ncbi:uncharacterized protein KNAG_0B00870 [Huiozyma naganishii CBS 8797]|uniref:BRO1 domain-containing protein n=1 Tax=Huiozyma naganishii (strain ATCC MYA-139 / BCRC 22969 / CBS 8797 / KCTC 17520 / NBRC 10181 / NCYC 3082 / Yp74L-3) TaxID=1071383 RepID=J7S373_HUIN7|nr:hypothetical protein KNAG_0B00870 [Kazachstania naganishii CBS 8797]CCK68534.1 hypothetical protein KNAG_0B00870 [Kazachstania naganishii CBS 8797]
MHKLSPLGSAPSNSNTELHKGELPLQIPRNLSSIESLSPNAAYLRDQVRNLLMGKDAGIDALLGLETLISYANEIFPFINSDVNLETEWLSVMIDIAFFYGDLALMLMQKAFNKTESGSIWSSSGEYLKKGLGILQFCESNVSEKPDHRLLNLIIEMSFEFQILQQLGVIMLSLCKLRNSLSNEQSTELDLQTNDLKESTSASLFYSKLCIGCHDTASQIKQIHMLAQKREVMSFLEGTAYLLLSLDQFRKDEIGTATGLLHQSVNCYSHFVPRTKFTSTVLSTPKAPMATKEKMRNKMHNTFLKTKQKANLLPFKARADNNKVSEIINDVMDTFLIPLVILLDYVFQQTNSKLFFQPVEKDSAVLKSLLPGGVKPDLKGIEWVFWEGRLQEMGPVSNGAEQLLY